jgi:CRP-like cAMP-binding protein
VVGSFLVRLAYELDLSISVEFIGCFQQAHSLVWSLWSHRKHPFFLCSELAMAVDPDFSVLTGNDVETTRIRAGGVIFRQGEHADEFFVIKSGYVRILVGNRTIVELSEDNIFGEMALIDGEPRSATAMAITDVELVPVSEKQFLFLVSQTPYFALKVMRTLARRLRVMNSGLA